jgi:hypothetical protein
VIQRGQALTASRRPDLQARPPAIVPRHRGGIERVNRLAELDHDVVRGVDHVADRADAGRHEPNLDGIGRRSDGHALDPAAHEARAQPLVLDADRQPIVDGSA